MLTSATSRCWQRVSQSSRVRMTSGVIIDSQLILSAHVAAVCRAGYYQLRKLCPVVRSITAEAARTVAAVFISNRLDYCNALLHGLPNTLLRKLQSVQNAAARLITGTT